MKKVIAIILIFLMLFTISQVFAATDVKVVFEIGKNEYSVNGQTYQMDVSPYIKDNRTFLPLRYVSYAVGVKPQDIAYNDGVVTINKNNEIIKLYTNSTLLDVNDTTIQMDTKPDITNGRVMVPIYWISKALNINIVWDDTTYTITIDYSEDNINSDNSDNSSSTITDTSINNPPTIPSATSAVATNEISKEFNWQYDNVSYDLKLQIPSDILEWDRKIPDIINTFYNSTGEQQSLQLSYMTADIRSLVLSCSAYANNNYVPLVTEKSNYDYIKRLAKILLQQAQKNGYDSFHTAEFIQSFVEYIPYKITYTPLLPVQTLVDGGDCKDKSILLASILKNLGYDVSLLMFPPPQVQQAGHMAVGIAFDDTNLPYGRNYNFTYYTLYGTKYYFTETTSPGWMIGQISDEQLEQMAYVYPVQ